MAEPKVHYQKEKPTRLSANSFTLCGKYIVYWNVKLDKKLVTCLNCKKQLDESGNN